MRKIEGIVPVMLTPFRDDGSIDWQGLERLTAWYLANGASALFAVCQSSEMQFLTLKEREFVTAARVAGASNLRIVTRHLLPTASGPIIVAVTLGIPAAILTAAILPFLGLGAPPPLPSWGSLVFESLDSVFTVPLLVLFPGLAISVTMLSFVFLGDGLRDALDPRSARR